MRLLKRTAQSPLIPQALHELNSLVNRHELTHLLGLRDITVTDVDRTALLLLRTNNHDEVVLRELASADLLLHGVAGDIDVGVEVVRAELLLELLAVVVGAGHDGDDEDLAGREPEGPLTAEVLGENGDEALEGAVDGTVDHDRTGAAGGELAAVAAFFLLDCA
jgi:hypothetical protein